jgi:hypothetical protein
LNPLGYFEFIAVTFLEVFTLTHAIMVSSFEIDISLVVDSGSCANSISPLYGQYRGKAVELA